MLLPSKSCSLATAVGLLLFLHPATSWACATCGLSSSYTPLMFWISTGFVLLPSAFAGYIGWRLWKETQLKKIQSVAETSSSTQENT